MAAYAFGPVGRPANPLTHWRSTRDGEKSFIAVHCALKGCESLPGEFEEAGRRARRLCHPGSAAANAERGCLVEAMLQSPPLGETIVLTDDGYHTFLQILATR